MSRTFIFSLAFWLALPVWAQAAPATDPGAPVQTKSYGSAVMQDGKHGISRRATPDMGILVPDMKGNYVLIPAGKRPDPDPHYVEAQELKLRVRELVSQLLDTWPNGSISNLVAVPTSFVSLDNFDETSGLGRYLAEAMFYEFNTRGFAVREYRMNSRIHMRPDGEFALTRNMPDVNVSGDWAALVVGTFYRDKNAVFINARMVRPSDGLVLRTAQLVLPMNETVKRMSATPPFRTGTLRINPGPAPATAARR